VKPVRVSAPRRRCSPPDIGSLGAGDRHDAEAAALAEQSGQINLAWLVARGGRDGAPGAVDLQDTATANKARKAFMDAKNQLRSSGDIAYN
jgi:hypothetical protein